MIQLTLEAKGFKELEQALSGLTRNPLSVAAPEIRRIGEHLRDSVKATIASEGFVWNGNLRDSIEMVAYSPEHVAVEQNEKGLFVMYGFGPQATGGPPPAYVKSDGLVEWCMAKFGLEAREAYGPALKIFRQGIMSPRSSRHYPSGAMGFNYADYVVNVKERVYLDQAAQGIGELFVKYLDTRL